jgi:hypothetical protein
MSPTLAEYHFEEARRTRVIRVVQRRVAIGFLYDAYLPIGAVQTETELGRILDELPRMECRAIEVVPA